LIALAGIANGGEREGKEKKKREKREEEREKEGRKIISLSLYLRQYTKTTLFDHHV
jgi:hypothetical protein